MAAAVAAVVAAVHTVAAVLAAAVHTVAAVVVAVHTVVDSVVAVHTVAAGVGPSVVVETDSLCTEWQRLMIESDPVDYKGLLKYE